MAPLVLKIKGNKSFSPFSNLDSEEDLSKTWRVCTKVKDSLENGSRLENLSWRLWFRQHAINEKSMGGPFQKLSKTTASQLDHHQGKLVPLKDKKIHSSPKKRKTAVPATTAFTDNPKIHQPVLPRCAFDQQSLIPDNYNIIPTPTVLHLQQQPISQPQQQQPFPYPSSSHSSPLIDSSSLSNPEQHPPSGQSPSPLVIDTNQNTSNFTLHRFTSDQAIDEMVELEDIFDAFDGGFLQQAGTTQLLMDDSNWATGATAPAVSVPHGSTPITTTVPSLDNNTSNYCTPLSSPLAQHSYHRSIQQPLTATTHQQQYRPNFPYHNQQPQYQPQYQDQNSNQRYSQQHSYPSPVNNYGMFMSVPSSPSFVPQQMPSDFQSPTMQTTTLETVYVTNPYSVQPPSSTGSRDMKLVDSTPQHSTLHTSSSTPPLSTSTSSSSSSTSALTTATTTPSKNDEICAKDDDTSTQNTTNAPSTIALAMMNNDQSYPLRHPQYHHQHVFPASAPTTPPLHTQPNPFDLVPRHHLNTATLSPATSSATSTPRILDVAGTDAKPICTNCAATSTPLWRRSSEDELLCNACGLYQKLHNAPRPKTLKPHNSRKETKEEEAIQLICSNCSTTTTPLWRRDDEGAPLCNACGLYLKLHHERRPLSMKTDIIKKRQRYETNTQASGRKLGKKTKGDPSSSTTTPSSSLSSPSHSTPPSPDVSMTAVLTDKDYHMIQTARTAPSSPTSHQHILPYSHIHQHHLPSFMD